MAAIRQLGQSSIGGTYLQSLRPRGLEQSFSVRDKLDVKYYRDFYERSSVQLRWTQFQGGDGWQGAGVGLRGQPYAPWQPYRGG